MIKKNLRLEALDIRAVPAALLANGVLTVEGTEARDVIGLVQGGGQLAVVGQKIEVNGTLVAKVPAAEVTAIVIHSFGGNDRIAAANVQIPVTVDAGPGNDWILGTRGNDTIIGGAGNDTIASGAGDDNLSGGSGDDRLYSGSGNDNTSGDDGNDSIYGEAGDDSIFGGNGNDLMGGGNDDDSLTGETGDDSIFGGNGNDSAFGGSNDDSINGGNGDDSANGDDGDDSVFGGSGSDDCFGGVGDDSVVGGAGNDDCFGDSGDDSVVGGSGDDNCDGGSGVDHLFDDNSGGGSSSGLLRAEGTIVGVDTTANTVTIQMGGGVQVTVTVDASTKIEVNEAHATLADLVVGARGEVKYNASGVAVEVEAGEDHSSGGGGSGGGGGGGSGSGAFRVEGTVTAIDTANKTVTIRKANGSSVTVIVVATTKIEINDAHAEFGELITGVFGEARYDATGIATKLELQF